MSFVLFFSSKARRQIKKLPGRVKEKIKEACSRIQEDPYSRESIKVEGKENMRRVRVGRFRVLYIVIKPKKEILVVKIEKRSEETYRF